MSSEEFALKARSLALVAGGVISGWIASDNNNYDSSNELLYSPIIPKVLSYGQWGVFAKIIPQDHLIPINNLFLPDGVTMRKEYEYPWKKIWELMGQSELPDLILDFLDRDTMARAGSREEEYFPNGPISDLSELLRLPEVNGKILYGDKDSPIALDKFFTVYGETTTNMNLAPKLLLTILDTELDEIKADALIAYRQGADLKGFADLLKSPGFPRSARARLGNIVGFKSTFFQVELKVFDGEGRERSFTMTVRRSGKQCEIVSWRE